MPEARFDLVRFGIAAYGISPFDDTSGTELGLVPVMRLEATVTDVHLDGSRRARIGIGFADGMPTLGMAKASVLVNGSRRPIVDIGPDSTVIDYGNDRLHVGDTAIVFGAGIDGEPTAEKWADWAETIGDEMVTGVMPRVQRVYVG